MSKQKTATSGAKVRKTLVNVLIHIFLAILAFIWVLPVFWVVLTSFRAEKGSYVETFFPKTYTLNNYVKLFTDTSILNFPKMFMNTLIIAIFTCIISTIFVLSVSYCMSRMRFKMRKPFMNIAMILIGVLIFLSFPFIVLQKIKKTKQEDTYEAKKKLNLFLICMMPVPVIAIVLILLGLKAFI